MCGIVGIVDFHHKISDKKHILEGMKNKLSHRGPDDEGSFISNNVLLGHRRLVVVDPKGGSQPMIKNVEGNEYIIVYNGELYNTEELRRDLISKGMSFDAYSDTEVLLKTYIYYGEGFISKLNGIFAFAIYDKKRNKIILARDPMGVKPLFYYKRDNMLVFASEIKALFEHPYIEPIIDETSLTELFSLGPAIAPGSGLYKDIYEVEPGYCMTMTYDDFKIYRYWQMQVYENKETIDEAIQHTRELLLDSIKRQLVSDVPICTFLSGGLDSSAISAVVADEFKKHNKTLTTYSIDYEDNDKYFKSSLFQPTSDQKYALDMASFIGSNHITVTLKHRDLEEALTAAVIGRDMPGMVDVDSSLYLFCKDIRKDFIVGLSGECADEIFGGYPWFTRPSMYNSNTFPWSRFLEDRKLILNKNLKNLKIDECADYYYKKTIGEAPHLDNETPFEHRMKEIYYLNQKWFMVTLLNRKDRMSMANSLEVRVPFADYRLCEYAYNLPNDYKLLHGREKGLLRKALEGILPDEIIYRKKSPYPKTHNPLYTKIVCEEMNRILNDNNSPILDLIDKDVVSNIVKTKGASYVNPWYGQLMTGPQLIAYFIQINTWLKEYNVSIQM